MSDAQKRVVITGLGVVSPSGCDLDALWGNLASGTSAIAPIEQLNCEALPFRSGGEVKEFTGGIENYGELDKKLQRAIKKNMKVMCREIEMGVAASQKALLHSGLGPDRDPERCGCLFGCDYILTRPEEYADGLVNCRNQSEGDFDEADWPTNGLSKVTPLWLLKYLPNMPNSHVSIYNDFRGPNNSITDRDASTNLSISEATSIIQRGAADVMLVGATGSRLHPLRTVQVSLIDQVAEQASGEPASRPFDVSSPGMILGEGAAALMLESHEHAEARGARIWGEVLGSGAAMAGSTETSGWTQASYDSMKAALRSADQRLPERWHLHAQGLGAPSADLAEAKAISALLKGSDPVPVTAAKSYFGNLGAGSAAVEIICSLLALDKDELFPILNLENPLTEIDWNPAEKGQSPGDAFLHSSFTLQGQASSVVIGRA